MSLLLRVYLLQASSYTTIHESYLNINGIFYKVLLWNMRETCMKHVLGKGFVTGCDRSQQGCDVICHLKPLIYDHLFVFI